jgi:hypothetical protein
MTFRKSISTSLAAAALVASTGLAFAQATGTENNATSGSAPSSSEQQMKTGSDNKGAAGATGGSMEMKGEKPTSAGTSNDQAKDLRGHSETPTTGK